MSTEESSSSDEAKPLTPPSKDASKRLNCVMFRTTKRRVETVEEEYSEDSTESESEKNVPPPTKKVKKMPTVEKRLKKKRIRKLIPCDVCGAKQRNIWRHMKLYHSDDRASTSTETKKLSKKGYIVRVCPFKKCKATVERMRDHLVRKHKVANKSARLDALLTKATPVME